MLRVHCLENIAEGNTKFFQNKKLKESDAKGNRDRAQVNKQNTSI